jgi:RNA polymerase sigma-70 factor (ECF subfamily)
VAPGEPDPDLEALRAAGADRDQVLARVFERHRRRLLKMVHLRMDPHLKAREGVSDVLQEAYLEISDRLDAYLQDPRLPFFLWLRTLTAQRLIRLHRRHVGAQRRDVRRQVPLQGTGLPEASSVAMVDVLEASMTSPPDAALRTERRARLAAALDTIKSEDRDVLVLRHFEELSNGEVAAHLGIGTAAASKRYVRALRRLQEVLREAGMGDSLHG